MKKIVLLFSAFLFSLATMADNAPAFPGAEGHGRFVTGGRGGTIIHVTNLNDSGAGSFRSAVSGSGKKIIVFDVAGVIALKSNLNIGANTTILGQTAPAPGITLRYYTVNPNGNNIIVRYIRFRRGQEKDVNDGADASTARHLTGIIFDHCSFSWSIDEVASFYDNTSVTTTPRCSNSLVQTLVSTQSVNVQLHAQWLSSSTVWHQETSWQKQSSITLILPTTRWLQP